MTADTRDRLEHASSLFVPVPAAGEAARGGGIETRTARVWLRDEGVVQVSIRNDLVQGLADAEANIAAAMAAAAGRRRPLLTDIRCSEPLPPEVRHFYTGPRVVEAFSALAMLIGTSAFSRLLGNMYLRVARLDIPTRLFTAEHAAVVWLTGFAT